MWLALKFRYQLFSTGLNFRLQFQSWPKALWYPTPTHQIFFKGSRHLKGSFRINIIKIHLYIYYLCPAFYTTIHMVSAPQNVKQMVFATLDMTAVWVTAMILTRLGLAYCTSRDIGDWIALCLLVGVGLPALCRWGCDREQSDFFYPLI